LHVRILIFAHQYMKWRDKVQAKIPESRKSLKINVLNVGFGCSST